MLFAKEKKQIAIGSRLEARSDNDCFCLALFLSNLQSWLKFPFQTTFRLQLQVFFIYTFTALTDGLQSLSIRWIGYSFCLDFGFWVLSLLETFDFSINFCSACSTSYKYYVYKMCTEKKVNWTEFWVGLDPGPNGCEIWVVFPLSYSPPSPFSSKRILLKIVNCEWGAKRQFNSIHSFHF